MNRANLPKTSFTAASGRTAIATKQRPAALVALALAALAAGCGGGATGSAPSSSAPGTLQTTAQGSLRMQYLGQAKPFETSTSGPVFVTSMAGSSIKNLYLIPPQRLSDTSIAYDQGFQLYTFNWGTGVANMVTTGLIKSLDPSWSHDGRLAFSGFDSADGHYQIYTCYPDGSHLLQLTGDDYDHNMPSWSPDDTKIVFSASTNKHLYSMPSGGGSESYLNQSGTWPFYSPDGTEILYTIPTGGFVEIMPAAGGAYTSDLETNFATWFLNSGETLATTASESGDQDVEEWASGFVWWTVLQPQTSSVNDRHPTPSPDGSMMAFMQGNSSTNNLVVSQTSAGASPSPIVATNAGGQYPADPAWSPFLTQQSYVGSTGTLSPSAAGFLWSQVNSSFASLLVFTVTTPSSASIVQQNSGSGGALVYQISADSVNTVYYTNGYYIPRTAIVPETSQLFVTIDPSSGQVETAAPFIMAKRAAGAQLSYTGKFTAIYDAKGNNLAPHGASTVTLDRKTGKLISAH